MTEIVIAKAFPKLEYKAANRNNPNGTLWGINILPLSRVMPTGISITNKNISSGIKYLNFI